MISDADIEIEIDANEKKKSEYAGRIVKIVEEDWGTTTFFSKDEEPQTESVDNDINLVSSAIEPSSQKMSIITVSEKVSIRSLVSQVSNREKVPSDDKYSDARMEIEWKMWPVARSSQRSLVGVVDSNGDGGDGVTNRLPYFMACLFATILEDTITEIRILFECNTEMRISKIMSDMNLLLALKYGVAQPTDVDELEGIDPRNLGCAEYKLNKLDSDRKYIHNVLLTTYKDLSLKHTYTALSDHVDAIISLDEYRAVLAEEEVKNRILRRELAKQLRQQRNHIKTVTYETDAIIEELGTQVEDAALNSAVRSRYMDNWQRARTEQHSQTIADKEFVPSHSIEYHKQRADQEQRVHSEVELLINIAIGETLGKVEEWMEKYDTDMEAIDLKIQIQKNDYKNMLDKRISLEETIELHERQMKEWLQFKHDREEARKYVEKMTNAAIAVQAWWRGVLVRCELGPFRVVRKGKPKGKKK